MRSIIVAATLCAAMTLGLQAKYPEIGQAAPDFSLTDIDGKTHKLSDYKGKYVVIEWTNPECPFVVKHYQKSGNIPALQKKYTEEDVVWLAINSAHPGAQGDYEPAEVKDWAKENNAAFTAYFRDRDGKAGKLYGATNTPGMYVIDKNGVLVYAGAIDSVPGGNPADIARATNYVEAALIALQTGQPVSPGQTRQYGCPVKYGR